MNAAYLLGGRLAEAFSADEWWTALDTQEPRMNLGEMPLRVAADNREDMQRYGPGQVPITTEQATDLSRAGFAALCGDDTACSFIMARTLRLPGQHEDPEATEIVKMMTRLLNVMAVARLAQYVRKAALHFSREARSRQALERRLKGWIRQYAREPGETEAPAEDQRRPLNEANIELVDRYSEAGQCHVWLWLRPNLPGGAPFGTVFRLAIFTLPNVDWTEV